MKSERVKQLHEKNFKREAGNGLAVIDFWAPWCGPCRAMGPVFETAAGKLGEKAVFAKVDVDENPRLAAQFSVKAIPTLVFLKNGNVMRKLTGVQSAESIGKTLDSIESL